MNNPENNPDPTTEAQREELSDLVNEPARTAASDTMTDDISEDISEPGGVAVIRSYLKTLPNNPGVYRMINEAGKVLYVGKAKSLIKRVTSYTNLTRQSNRIRRMVLETTSMEFVTTHTEAEALLLEANLIKRYAPRYNILLRDDKSFPQIMVTGDHGYPQIVKHRGARKRKGDYFGPFASAWAVNETLTFLQKVFNLRTCTDAVFESRSRPCLLFQIKRCSAPCVERISKQDYNAMVDQARAFLNGRSTDIQQQLAVTMQAFSNDQEYEQAALYRDRIRALTQIQSHQDINLAGMAASDVIAIHHTGAQTCVQVFFFRSGQSYGNRAYFPTHGRDDDAGDVLEAFIAQFYDKAPPAKIIILNINIPNRELIEEALSLRAEHKIKVMVPTKGDKRKLALLAETNARKSLERRLAESATQRKLIEDLSSILNLDTLPQRIEIYDNSHISGTNAIGAMVVAGPDGFIKNAYRKFNIKGDKPTKIEQLQANPTISEQAMRGLSDNQQAAYSAGDDYAMMREVLMRRFSRVMKEDPDREGGQWPNLLLIDGGPGQLSIAVEVLAELGIEDVAVAGVAKGPERNAGRETVYMPGKDPINLEHKDPVLHFIQRLRDEAHRFAIGVHRSKRGKAAIKSVLDEIPGVGGSRKKALLHHFGAASDVAKAGLDDLKAVDGISKAMAERVYEWFHPDD